MAWVWASYLCDVVYDVDIVVDSLDLNTFTSWLVWTALITTNSLALEVLHGLFAFRR